MSIRDDQLKKACHILDDVLANRPNERDELIVAVQTVFQKRKGKWIILDECSNEGIYCSECHKKVLRYDYSNTMKLKNFKYCPNCGADMRGEEDAK